MQEQLFVFSYHRVLQLWHTNFLSGINKLHLIFCFLPSNRCIKTLLIMESLTTGRYFWVLRREGNLFSARTSLSYILCWRARCVFVSRCVCDRCFLFLFCFFPPATGWHGSSYPLDTPLPVTVWPGTSSPSNGTPFPYDRHSTQSTPHLSRQWNAKHHVENNGERGWPIPLRHAVDYFTSFENIWGGDWVGILFDWKEGLSYLWCIDEITDSGLLTDISLDWTQTETTIGDFCKLLSPELYMTGHNLCQTLHWPFKKHSLSPSTYKLYTII